MWHNAADGSPYACSSTAIILQLKRNGRLFGGGHCFGARALARSVALPPADVEVRQAGAGIAAFSESSRFDPASSRPALLTLCQGTGMSSFRCRRGTVQWMLHPSDGHRQWCSGAQCLLPASSGLWRPGRRVPRQDWLGRRSAARAPICKTLSGIPLVTLGVEISSTFAEWMDRLDTPAR